MNSRQALVVRGGWEGHQPEAATDLFLPYLRDQGFTVTVADSPAVYEDTALLAGTDLVVQCFTMGTITKEQSAGLTSAVAAGTGFAGWHGGIVDAFRNDPDYLHLTGGQFACHPEAGGETFVPHRIEITGEDHPITAGIDDFDLVTEQYWVLTDPYSTVLATTTHAAQGAWKRPVTVPAVWIREWGQGKVFVATPGHDLDTLKNDSVRVIVERGLTWASR
ncbi:ThuA domain-containing protein [Herbidospora mongoliensis]|uniref:ThuA domain-containing protein n=1 Tax=Herbidospora mongoliensis TaxID=688067 RepID=UPI00082A9548|nr:ThuA domain-containing protein [Herbidospora mongoliensis]